MLLAAAARFLDKSSSFRSAVDNSSFKREVRNPMIRRCYRAQDLMILGQICPDFEASLKNPPNLSGSRGQPRKMFRNSPIIAKIFLNTHNGLRHLNKLLKYFSSSEKRHIRPFPLVLEQISRLCSTHGEGSLPRNL